MTFREKLQQEHQEKIGDHYIGGCHNCPANYGYEEGNQNGTCEDYKILLNEDASEYALDALCSNAGIVKCRRRKM